ncbi:hypothetical protein, partial [Thiolapillus sp.]
MGQNYRKTMLCPQKDNQIPFPSGTSGKIDVFFNSLLELVLYADCCILLTSSPIGRFEFSAFTVP